MSTIEKRGNTYRITVCSGYDINGKQIRNRMTYKPEPNMTAKQIEKEVQRQAVLFEEQCQNGTAPTDGKTKLADFVPIYLENAKNKLNYYSVTNGRAIIGYLYRQTESLCIQPHRHSHSVNFLNATDLNTRSFTHSDIHLQPCC